MIFTKPAIKPYKDPINCNDNHPKGNNGVSKDQEDKFIYRNAQNYPKQEQEAPTHSGLTSNCKKKNQVSDCSDTEKMNSGKNHDAVVPNTTCQPNTKYNESNVVYSPYSHTSEKARLIESEMAATSDFDSSEGNCDECNPHEHQMPLAPKAYPNDIKHIHLDPYQMPIRNI